MMHLVARRVGSVISKGGLIQRRTPFLSTGSPFLSTSSPFLSAASTSILRYCSTTPAASVVPVPSPSTAAVNTPSFVDKYKHTRHKVVEKVKEEFHRVVNGSKVLGQNTKTAAYLVHNMTKGHILTRREKMLLITTVADLIRMVPFIVIVLVPFAEFALPILLKVFPNMLPSTFTSASQQEASRARKIQAKLKVLEVLQAASESITLRNKLDSQEVQQHLVAFMEKVSRGEEAQPEEILEISKIFHSEFSLESLDRPQLVSLAKFFGIPPIGTSFILQESLRFKWNLVTKDDAHILRDGLDSLSPAELEEAAISRGYSHHNSHHDQKRYVQEWIALSQANVPPYLLLLSRAYYFAKNTKRMTDITPPIIAPYLPPLPDQSASSAKTAAESTAESEPVIDMPEKEIIPIEFKNLSHEFSHNPVVSQLWGQIARYTSELKKETFGDRQGEVIHLGDASADNLSTVITAELRKYLQALFVALDKNGDRKLTVDEVEHGLLASDIPVSHEEALLLVKLHDADRDNSLSFDEFVDCLLYLRKNQAVPEVSPHQ